MAEPKYRAKIEILHYITSFCLLRDYHKNAVISDQLERAFISGLPPIGSLVVLTSAPATKWYLGWYRGEVMPAANEYMKKHVIESIEDGSLCNWSNVGFAYLNPKIVNEYPSWHWTDKQFEFNDIWHKANRKSENNYVFRLANPEFKEDGSVVLGLKRRISFEETPIKYSKTLSANEWKKVTLKSLVDFINTNIKKELK